LFIQGIHHRNR